MQNSDQVQRLQSGGFGKNLLLGGAQLGWFVFLVLIALLILYFYDIFYSFLVKNFYVVNQTYVEQLFSFRCATSCWVYYEAGSTRSCFHVKISYIIILPNSCWCLHCFIFLFSFSLFPSLHLIHCANYVMWNAYCAHMLVARIMCFKHV